MSQDYALHLGDDQFVVRTEVLDDGVSIAAYDTHGRRVSAVYILAGLDVLPQDAEPVESFRDFLEGELRRLQLLRLGGLSATVDEVDED